MTGQDHTPGHFRPAADDHPLNQTTETRGTDIAPTLTGATAAVRELLLALSVGFSIPSPLPDSLGDHHLVDHGGLDSIIAAAKDAGLLSPDGSVVGTARYALLKGTPTARIRALQKELVDKTLQEGQALGELARDLARSGFKNPRVVAELERSADAVLETDPAQAAELYSEALMAGGTELDTAARRAQATAATGDLDSAGRIVDRLLAMPEPPDLRLGVDVAAAVWAQRGMLSRSADTYSWLGSDRIDGSAPLAAVAMIGSGNSVGAEELLAVAPPSGSPTLLAVALSLTQEGLRQTLGPAPELALPELIRASDMMNAAGTSIPLPETPSALAALCALHSGEPGVADTVLKAALAGGQGGDAARPRLFLLRAWSSMQQDNADEARLAINEAVKANHWPLAPRDEFLLAALDVGLARRGSDVHELVLAWDKAREAMMHVSVDLYSLLPWGELMITAARLRESRRVSHYVEGAWDLLGRLGNPPLWSVPLHWAAVQAALLSEDPAGLAPHAAALVRASEHSHLASVLAAGGKAWVSVLAGRFEASDVETAARGLAAVGMPWEGARLAGHAAAHADERRDMVKLLACARDIHPQSAAPSGGASERQEDVHTAVVAPSVMDNGGGPGNPDSSGLSAREREVARLILEGKTYREIGEAIYISPRTAEHHVARMRRRLGAENRSELLVRLRLALGEGYPPP
ncbi:LuxR C-terminal-related transcriptional regulator [Paenarthrobacter aurescens]|jgi:DNA-binding CsgD family transcriptional regulator|uniref:Transcriptional regulator, LuxR family domain protein n=1 Tax=Paenarthrobacter aurescens (strain TC1) TaxID=290340 RepID=A1R9R8_PAEAT|nr:LuxR C-terminal-related transcriptional regulator [Paenarthrobacter aurescens]ABM08068.1 putative transcriptional regulator, LuxR family domain protein [Paenarthrobacter aurescens TC1]